MDVFQCTQQLEQQKFHVLRVQTERALLEEHTQVSVQILEHQYEMFFRRYDIVQTNYVGVVQVFEKRGLPDGREWDAFFLLETDLLEGDKRVVDFRYSFVNDCVRVFTDLFELRVLLNFTVWFGGFGGSRRGRPCFLVRNFECALRVILVFVAPRGLVVEYVD